MNGKKVLYAKNNDIKIFKINFIVETFLAPE